MDLGLLEIRRRRFRPLHPAHQLGEDHDEVGDVDTSRCQEARQWQSSVSLVSKCGVLFVRGISGRSRRYNVVPGGFV